MIMAVDMHDHTNRRNIATNKLKSIVNKLGSDNFTFPAMHIVIIRHDRALVSNSVAVKPSF